MKKYSSSRSGLSRVRILTACALVTVSALFSFFAFAAITPPGGTLTEASGPIFFTGGPYLVANPSSQANGAEHRQLSRRRAVANATSMVMKMTVQTASDESVDAYTVLNEKSPARTAASMLVDRSNHVLANRNTTCGKQAFNAAWATSGIQG